MTRVQEAGMVSAEEIEIALREVPGVRDLYRSGSLASNLVGNAVAALGLRDGDEPLVSLSQHGAGIGVEASIAVDVDTSAAVTARAAVAAVTAVLDASGAASSGIRITVVHVQESNHG